MKEKAINDRNFGIANKFKKIFDGTFGYNKTITFKYHYHFYGNGPLMSE